MPVIAMNNKIIKQIIFSAAVAITSQSAIAETPGLWDGSAASPQQSLHVPNSQLQDGSFEYVSLSPIYFDFNKATLTRAGQQSLDAASEYLHKHANIRRILVDGHTDEKGSISYNDNLSDRRAKIVRNYLIVKGINPNLVNLAGMGEHKPVDQNWTRDGRQRNRHVSIYAVHWNH